MDEVKNLESGWLAENITMWSVDELKRLVAKLKMKALEIKG